MIDLHIHSSLSDGRAAVYEILEQAEKKRLGAIAITDHGPGHVFGATNRELRRLAGELRAMRDSYRVKVLAGVEAEVGEDGSLGLDDDIKFDIVLASIHASAGEEDYFRRLKLALSKFRIDVVAHHGLYLSSSNMKLNEEVIELMKARKVAVEINSFHRLPDLDFLSMCAQAGIKFTTGSDAHSIERIGDVSWASRTGEKIFGSEGMLNENEIAQSNR